MALAVLNDDRFPTLAKAAMERPQAYIQMQTVQAASGYLQRKDTAGVLSPVLRTFAQSLYDSAAANPDRRVYSKAIPLLAAFEPKRCLEMLAAKETDERFRNDLLNAVANDDALFTAWIGANPDNSTLLAIASRRSDERLAGVLLARLDALVTQDPAALYAAARLQGDAQLTRALFARYADLRDPLKSYMPVLLERTFNARIGNNLDTWREYLAGQKWQQIAIIRLGVRWRE